MNVLASALGPQAQLRVCRLLTSSLPHSSRSGRSLHVTGGKGLGIEPTLGRAQACPHGLCPRLPTLVLMFRSREGQESPQKPPGLARDPGGAGD